VVRRPRRRVPRRHERDAMSGFACQGLASACQGLAFACQGLAFACQARRSFLALAFGDVTCALAFGDVTCALAFGDGRLAAA
jgi:hypothetical protein